MAFSIARGAGAVALNDFDQSHQRRRIEKVQARALVPGVCVLAAMAVTLNEEVLVAKKRLRRADGIQLLEDIALEIEFFRRRFDDQVAPLKSSRLVVMRKRSRISCSCSE